MFYRFASLLVIICLYAPGLYAQPDEPAAVERAKQQTYEAVDLGPFSDSIHHYQMDREENEYAQYAPEQIVHIAENLLLYQAANGGWPKNQDWTRVLSDDEAAQLQETRAERRTTLDNRSTYPQIGYLAGVYRATGLARYKEAALRGLDHVLREQHPSGGWRGADVEAITYNDDVMTGVLHTLYDVAHRRPPFDFVDEERRLRAETAVENGIACILRSQVVIDGRRTAWGQQHDHDTYAPMDARTFEKASLTASESVGVVRFLMRLEPPSPAVVDAIQGAVSWFDAAKITGIRVETVPAEPIKYPYHISRTDRVVVEDAAAPPIWARFYDLETGRPFFTNRDGVNVYTLAEVTRERRTGYAWYGYWPAGLLAEEYPAWQKKWVLR